jgi:hypothetical protein
MQRVDNDSGGSSSFIAQFFPAFYFLLLRIAQ